VKIVQANIRQIFISPGHNYFGHHGKPAGVDAAVEVNTIHCVTGRGIEGDRFFDYKPDYKGQITFFSWEDYEATKRQFGVPALSAGAFRRNVLISGIDVLDLVGCRFEVQGVVFEGTGEAKPCYWMDRAVAPGAEAWLNGRGGLRAKILSDGRLTTGLAEVTIRQRALSPAFSGSPAPV
jgi:MOSC domain-containing protein YiiM